MERLHPPTEFHESSPRTALNQPVVEVDAANAVKERCLLAQGSALKRVAIGFGEGGRQLRMAGFAGLADRSLDRSEGMLFSLRKRSASPVRASLQILLLGSGHDQSPARQVHFSLVPFRRLCLQGRDPRSEPEPFVGPVPCSSSGRCQGRGIEPLWCLNAGWCGTMNALEAMG